jgi:hypothetical protein
MIKWFVRSCSASIYSIKRPAGLKKVGIVIKPAPRSLFPHGISFVAYPARDAKEFASILLSVNLSTLQRPKS